MDCVTFSYWDRAGWTTNVHVVRIEITQLRRTRTRLFNTRNKWNIFDPFRRMAPGPAPARPRPLSRGIINTKQTKVTSRRARARTANEIHQPPDKAVNYWNVNRSGCGGLRGEKTCTRWQRRWWTHLIIGCAKTRDNAQARRYSRPARELFATRFLPVFNDRDAERRRFNYMRPIIECPATWRSLSIRLSVRTRRYAAAGDRDRRARRKGGGAEIASAV